MIQTKDGDLPEEIRWNKIINIQAIFGEIDIQWMVQGIGSWWRWNEIVNENRNEIINWGNHFCRKSLPTTLANN